MDNCPTKPCGFHRRGSLTQIICLLSAACQSWEYTNPSWDHLASALLIVQCNPHVLHVGFTAAHEHHAAYFHAINTA